MKCMKSIICLFLFVALFGCGGGSNTSVSLVSIAVTPVNLINTQGTTQQFTATGSYTYGSTQDLTASVTWTSSDIAVATISNAGLAISIDTGSTTITATSGSISGSTTLTVNPLSLTRIKTVTITTDAEGGSARPEIIATDDRVLVVYLGNHTDGSNRTFNVKIFDSNLDNMITSKTIVVTTDKYGGPTDIRIASDGQYLYAFYETTTVSTTYLWGAKYTLDDNFQLVAYTSTPIISSPPVSRLKAGDEVLNDPAPLVGQDSVFVITRLMYSISTSGNTIYRVREFNKGDLSKISEFDLDLSNVADGRARVASLLFWNNSIYMALATTISDQGVIENNDDGALCDIILVKMGLDWTFNSLTDVQTISSEPDDRENYITGFEADNNYFYMTYKQAVGSPPTGERRAVIKFFDAKFNLVHKEIVKTTSWGPSGGEIRPSIKVMGNRIFSGQSSSSGQGIGIGNAEVYVYEKK